MSDYPSANNTRTMSQYTIQAGGRRESPNYMMGLYKDDEHIVIEEGEDPGNVQQERKE